MGILCLLFTLASCTDGEVYYHFHHIDQAKWQRDNMLIFTMDSSLFQPDKDYNLSIELSTNRGYPYRDLWLTVDHNLTDTVFQTDTLHITMANEQGVWLGSGVGGIHQLSTPYLDQLSPSLRDSITGYRVIIGQLMHDNPLKGVEKVGLKIVEGK